MANTKEYKIVINGLTESINAVESLNKQLDALEKRMEKINASKVSTGGGSSASRSNVSALSEEEAIQKEINKLKQQGAQLDAKIAASQDEIFKRVDATKQLYKETLADQKAIAAQERLTANAYSNTMQGMKQQLADIKAVINTTDLGDSDKIKKLTQQANELTQKLKEMEEAYGQFGRNVGNYQSAFDGLDKLTIEIGGVAREFGSAREAAKTFKNELTALEMQGKGNTEEAKELRKAYNQLKSAMDDATKSSKAMDNAMDWMTSFTAIASIGNGIKGFFGFDDNEITKSIQKLVALQSVLNGIENIRKQMDTGEGIGAILSKGSQGVDKFVASITGAQLGVEGLTKSSRLATVAVRSLSIAMKGLGIGLIITAISGLVDMVQKAGTAIQGYFKGNADLIDASHAITTTIEAENNALKKQQDIVSSNFMKGYIDETNQSIMQFANTINYLADQELALWKQSNIVGESLKNFNKIIEEGWGKNGVSINTDFADFFTKDVPVFIKNIDGAKEAWKDFYKAVKSDKDILSSGHSDTIAKWLWSFVATADDAKDTLVSIGQVIAASWAKSILEINLSTESGIKELGKLIDELNNDQVTRSVLMNLGDYFDDKEVISRIQNVIKYAQELNDAFNFEKSDTDRNVPGKGYEYYEQVRIDAMKDGAEKIRRQNKLNHDKEIAELDRYGQLTDEHRKQIDAKYNRQLQEQLKVVNQQQRDAENDLINLRLQMMKEGFEKEKAQLNQERKERIQKVVQSGILVGERTVAINNLYDKKIADAKKKWAADILKTYQDLYQNIQELNRATFNMEGDNAQINVENRAAQNKQNAGYSLINPATFDDSKTLEEYYRRVLEIEKKASDMEARIRQERLDKELEYNKQEENLRHERLANIDNGEYKQQLEAGKITQEQYDELMEDEKNAHNARMNALDKEYAAQSTQVIKDQLEEQQRLYNQYYSSIISDLKKDKQKIDTIMTKQPVVDTQGWNVVNMKKTSENYNTALTQYEELKKNIIKKQQELDEALKAKRISPEDFAMRKAELKDEMKAIDEAVKNVKDRQKQLVAEFVQSLMPYVQAAVDSFQNIMSSLWDAQDVQFDKEQEYLDKLNEELDKKLQEQEDIIDRHKSAVDSIEEELATARGDRRQHLIDQLNAEMAAQRAAAAEEKKIQKQKEAAEKKQDELEKKRKQAQYKRDMLQAIVNGAMAVTYAAINAWPIPAVPMMALAAATTAAQVAIMANNKPYAKGGLLEGKSHAQGGIPIPGTGIEVEGKEYVIRKSSTAKNIDLLDYINKSERKLSLDDFIDFYGGKVKRNVKSMSPGRKYADGGSLPTISNNYTFDDRLLSAFEDYSNRPVQVSVVDINNRQEAVRNVQVLAGITE